MGDSGAHFVCGCRQWNIVRVMVLSTRVDGPNGATAGPTLLTAFQPPRTPPFSGLFQCDSLAGIRGGNIQRPPSPDMKSWHRMINAAFLFVCLFCFDFSW